MGHRRRDGHSLHSERFSQARSRSFSRDDARERDYHERGRERDNRPYADWNRQRDASPHHRAPMPRPAGRYTTNGTRGRSPSPLAPSQRLEDAKWALARAQKSPTGREDMETAKNVLAELKFRTVAEISAWLEDPTQLGEPAHKERLAAMMADMGGQFLLHLEKPFSTESKIPRGESVRPEPDVGKWKYFRVFLGSFPPFFTFFGSKEPNFGYRLDDYAGWDTS